MKRAIVIGLLASGFAVSAQTKKSGFPKPKPTYCPEVKVDYTNAEFPGGTDSLNAFFNRNFVLPNAYPGEKTAKHPLKVTKHLFITYAIEPDGSLTNIKAPKGHDYPPDLVQEAVRVLKLSPKWKPATRNGKAFRVEHTGYVAKIRYYKEP